MGENNICIHFAWGSVQNSVNKMGFGIRHNSV
jgi:hypothetical protein